MYLPKHTSSLGFQCLLVLMTLQYSCSAPVPVNPMGYLKKYGYLEHHGNVAYDVMKRAIVNFQNMAGITPTGHIDKQTLEAMALPRCGNVDVLGPEAVGRQKRYALLGSKWGSPEVTYKIKHFTQDLNKNEVEAAIQHAAEIWNSFSDLSLRRSDWTRVAIEIGFYTGEHGDGDAFDGEGGVLAHAFFPYYGGDLHFDDSEQWAVSEHQADDKDKDLLRAATHELGHSLGIGHSRDPEAVMFAWYPPYNTSLKLGQDDIQVIKYLYGAPSNNAKWEDVCQEASIDAITKDSEGVTLIFEGDYYYRLPKDYFNPENKGLIDSYYPRAIKVDWDTVTGPIDAAFTITISAPDIIGTFMTFIFKGLLVWRLKFYEVSGNKGHISHGPYKIDTLFIGLPGNIDAAFALGSKKVFFIKDNYIWRLSGPNTLFQYTIDNGYPKPLSSWTGLPSEIDADVTSTNETLIGLPSKIDAAVAWSKYRIMFFSGGKYYSYNRSKRTIGKRYPLDIADIWFKCSDELGE